jgi:hypothetical membrane protein
MQFFRRGLPAVGFGLWSLCFQFFVGEQIARLGWPGPHSMTHDYISDLGAARSPLHWVMNGSFQLQGLLIFFGTVLVRRFYPAKPVYRIALSLLAVAGVGVLVVGLVPEDENVRLHLMGAAANFLGGNLAMILLGLVSAKQWYGRITLVLGSVGLLATLALMFRTGLGSEVGLVERLAAYPLPLWLTWTGLWMNGARASYDPTCRA